MARPEIILNKYRQREFYFAALNSENHEEYFT
jgi:hypothetical protein